MIERNAGMLNRRVDLQAPMMVADNTGGAVKSWSTTATVWAGVRPLQGRELAFAQQRHNEVTHQVTIRFRSGVTPDMRVLYDGRVLRIVAAIDVNEAHAWLELLCVEEAKQS